MEPGAQSSLRYRDKVAIITGGTTGIGQGTVRVFVSQGAKVVFCAKDVGAGNALEAELNSVGPGEAFYVACDVTKEEQIKNLIDVTVQKYGRIDCLVNNAGVHPPPQKTDDVTAEDFTSLLNLNLVSYFLASKYALPHLRKTEGNIVNVASLVAVIGQNDAVPYVATKVGGLLRFRSLNVYLSCRKRNPVSCKALLHRRPAEVATGYPIPVPYPIPGYPYPAGYGYGYPFATLVRPGTGTGRP
ncbi:L-fucose dehydrogenase isoform X2 [Lampetra fluviatilis]